MKRTEDDLRKYSEIYDFENDSPFTVPDENVIMPHHAEFLEDVQLEFDLDRQADSHAGAICASNRAEGERLTAEEKFFNCVPPATNRGIVKYDGEEYRESWGGYDGGVEASIMGEWVENSFTGFSSMLNSCKQCADNHDLEGSLCEFGGFVWKVSEKGANCGFFKYKWVLESHGVKLYVHSNPKGNIPAVRVRFGFECLARTNLFEAVKTLKYALENAGFIWRSEILSRVDMQVLLPVDIYEFTEAMKGKRVVSQCRGKWEMIYSCKTMRLETMTLRSGNAEICIYDKLAQVAAADSVYYITFHRWIMNYERPEFLTRVEFRFRRPMLRRYGITTFEDLRRSQEALPQVFGQEWFRILERDKVRGSENVIKNAPIWEKTLKAFRFYFSRENVGKRSSEELKKYKPPMVSPNTERLVKQAVGCLASFLSATQKSVLDSTEAIQKGVEVLKKNSGTLYFKITSKQIQNEVGRAFTPDNTRKFDCLDEIRQALTPIGVWEYLKIW